MKNTILLTIILHLPISLLAQSSEINPIIVGIPMLDFNTNARIGAMGVVGTVISSSQTNRYSFQNPALLSNGDQIVGGELSFHPWLRSVSDDMWLGELNAYYSLNKKNAVGYRYRILNLGQVYSVDLAGDPLDIENLKELFHQITYSHSFDRLSVGVGVKYVSSEVTSITFAKNNDQSLKTYSIDLGVSYHNTVISTSLFKMGYVLGSSIRNFGPKKYYSSETRKDFLPTDFSMGILIDNDWEINNWLTLGLEVAYQANKLLVPTPIPPEVDENGIVIKTFDNDMTPFHALYKSFYDAPGGPSEEFHEIQHRVGSEFRMVLADIIVLYNRLGRFMEHETKGNRNYYSHGTGIEVYGIALDYCKTFNNSTSTADDWIMTLRFSKKIDK